MCHLQGEYLEFFPRHHNLKASFRLKINEDMIYASMGGSITINITIFEIFGGSTKLKI